MIYAKPDSDGAIFNFRQRCGDFIDGEWIATAEELCFKEKSPVYGDVCCEVAASSDAGLQKALDATHKAALEHDQQPENILMSHRIDPVGLF